MTLEELRLKVQQWDYQNTQNQNIATAKYTEIVNHLDFHSSNNWSSYLPTEHPDYNSNYMERLAKWLGNVQSENEQKILLEYAIYISFFSHDDFAALYRTALRREVYPWLMTLLNLKLDTQHSSGQNFDTVLSHVVNCRTWYCPITDSMDINEFYKVNHISGISEKPQFSGLYKQFQEVPGSTKYWRNYIQRPNSNSNRSMPLEFIVLLEDIVGSGSQCAATVDWAVNAFDKPVLFIPLILCPNGVEKLSQLELKHKGKLKVRPIVELERKDLLGPERQNCAGWNLAQEMETLAKTHAHKLSSVAHSIDPFGYKSTGCSIATYSNTPDNSLPLIHRHNNQGYWDALFPRVYRD